MSWSPDPRPEWVRAVNAGEVAAVMEATPRRFELDRLLADAAEAVSAPDASPARFSLPPDADAFIADLVALLDRLEGGAQLTVFGRWFTWRHLRRLLIVRHHLAASIATDPSRLVAPVAAPWFLVGGPESGTARLHQLLALDPAHRVPRRWEFLRPAPPGEDRARLAAEELDVAPSVNPALVEIDRADAQAPARCQEAMALSFLSDELATRFSLPGYDPGADPARSYAIHRLVVQQLQRGTPARRWVFASLSHLERRAAVSAIYPSARFIVVHRDPVAVVAGAARRTIEHRWVCSDRVDAAAIGGAWLERQGRWADHLIDLETSGTIDDVVHVHHRDLMADPVATVAAVYEQLGEAFTEPAARAIAAAPPPPDEPPFDPTSVGLDAAAVTDRLAAYVAHFAVAPD